jgi:hypothetical protein
MYVDWRWLVSRACGGYCLYCIFGRKIQAYVRLRACNLSHKRARLGNTNIFTWARLPCLYYLYVSGNRILGMWHSLHENHRQIECVLHTWSLLVESARPGALWSLKLLFTYAVTQHIWNTALLENDRQNTTLLLDNVCLNNIEHRYMIWR